ncbi:SDR family oxidoreductase [Paeniglutamicibacter cryotolerans]|uniref:Dihydroflavonol-4-reductase n=1 Tax=Paeniglutamicibacter cryotolerans TaxID=670079 RepID=A0A839QMI0_9MICC|nr:aldehyde reductase [Paeniglutamicibacter cryotolerans]MBB2996803.1 dihydroflavonol-4-reductase [Paeniglutamicibacter cryotolerans]
MSGELVLVTGGTGFLGAHCVAQLIQQGYRVRTTVRSRGREAEVRGLLATAEVDPGDRLAFAVAHLLADDGWAEATAGCDYVLHVASPFPAGVPKDENELIVPAKEGALRVLRAARDAGVKRVVMTSSFAAVGYGVRESGPPFTEADWTNPGADVGAYTKSKTLAERAAWNFMATEGGDMELAAVNPVGIIGPVLGPKLSTSIQLVRQLLSGKLPGLPRISTSLVDVRDVADLHLRAMTNPAARGERFIAVEGPALGMREIARLLRERLGGDGNRIPTRMLPDWLVRAGAVFVPVLREVAPRLGVVKQASNEKAVSMLGWEPRPTGDSLVDTAQSLIRLGLI